MPEGRRKIVSALASPLGLDVDYRDCVHVAQIMMTSEAHGMDVMNMRFPVYLEPQNARHACMQIMSFQHLISKISESDRVFV